MQILGIETSCDETAIAVLEIKNNRVKVLTNTISSQIKLHAKYGGVVPNLAAREHVKNIGHVFKFALKESRTKIDNIDLITVTRGPGLGPALLVGIAFARTLAWKYEKSLIGVNHLEGHIYSNWLPPIKKIKTLRSFSRVGPILNLIVSGGHTELVLMKGYGKYQIIGETLDDAIGEAFDKVARLLGFSYPGGPIISRLAEKGDPNSYPLPSPMIKSKDYNFSYSGLKTAVLYLIRELTKDSPLNSSRLLGEARSKGAVRRISAQQKFDIAASFQKAALEVIIKKTIKAAQEYKVKSIFLSGGVSANKYLREKLEQEAVSNNIGYSQPEMEYTGDNAAMIAIGGYLNYKNPPPHKASAFAQTSVDKSRGTIKNSWESVEMDANLGF